ncbi:MAG: TSUP family transporter [Clostridia bacterium]|nr:TSUP family transporter [Clostridia bacterium]
MKFVYFILAGILGGILAGMGMGGGTLTLPILVLLLGVGQLTAQYANLIAFLPSGTAALLLHVKNGFVKTDNLAYLLIPALAMCAASSVFATDIGGDLLKKLFGGFLCLIALFSLFFKCMGNLKGKGNAKNA